MLPIAGPMFLSIGRSHNNHTYSVFTIRPNVACTIFKDAVVHQQRIIHAAIAEHAITRFYT